jgi:GntP family gluconate:H+ symporter
MYLLFVLIAIVGFIVVATAKFKLSPFLTLLLASFIAAFAYGLPAREIESTIRSGFGNIMGNIGLVIVLGTLIGVILERTGAAITMGHTVIRVFGKRFPTLTMSLVGFLVAIPVVCDSGFVILNSSYAQCLASGANRRSIDWPICYSYLGAANAGAYRCCGQSRHWR